MAKAKFDITSIHLPSEATRPLYAGVGVTDLVVEYVRGYVTGAQTRVADVQKSVSELDLQPQSLRDQAVTVVNSRVEALSKDAKARRAAIEARVAELQAEAKELPAKVQALLNENVATVTSTYGDLAKRGETLVGRIRNQESTKAATTAAKSSAAKAKTTKTQATKTAKKATDDAKSTAKKSASTAKKSPAKSSAKATATAAKTAASEASTAAAEGAEKIGD